LSHHLGLGVDKSVLFVMLLLSLLISGVVIYNIQAFSWINVHNLIVVSHFYCKLFFLDFIW